MIFLNLISIHISTVFRTLTFFRRYIQQAINSYSQANYELAVSIIMLFHLSSTANDLCLVLEDDSILIDNIDSFRFIIGLINDFSDIPLFFDVSNSLGLMALYERHPDFSYANPHLVCVLPGQSSMCLFLIIGKRPLTLDFQTLFELIGTYLFALKRNDTYYWST